MRSVFLAFTVATTMLAQTPQNEKRLIFSTYHGGDRNDDAVAAAVDSAGYVYITGESESRDLNATPVGGKPLSAAVFKGYLTKYAPGGKEMLWRLLIGGASNTVPRAIVLDRDENVWVAGTTGARDLPLVNPVQDKQTGLNICFLMKFDKEGKLLFSTYFGGDRNEEGKALATDSQGNIYLGGRATSTNLPVKNALQPQLAGGGQDGFIAKFTPGYQLAWATYFGGTGHTDDIFAMAVGPDDSLYVTGENMSPGLATENAWLKQPPSYSSFVAKISPNGDAVSYFTYIGHRSGYTTAQAITVDASGRAWLAGHTSAKQLPTTSNAIQPNYAGGFRDAFLMRLSADGSTAEYLTYLGGSVNGTADPDETASAVRVDQHGLVWIAGQTSSPDFPTARALQGRHGGMNDAYLLRLDTEAKTVMNSTFWGGGKKDAALTLALGPGEVATVAGEVESDDLPVLNAVQTRPGSAKDAFVMEVCEPWLTANPAAQFAYTIGSERPGTVELGVTSGCPQAFDATEVAVDQPWVALVADGNTVPMKIKVDVNPDGLEPGEYKATVRISVPDAFRSTLEVPVVLNVSAPPPPAEE